jgi:hypothetical protein
MSSIFVTANSTIACHTHTRRSIWSTGRRLAGTSIYFGDVASPQLGVGADFVVGVAGGFELKGGVFDVEVPDEAGLDFVEERT